MNYNVVREHNKPLEPVETSQGMSEESPKLPLSGTNDKIKARLRDCLRFLCIKSHRTLSKNKEPDSQSSALADIKPVVSETTSGRISKLTKIARLDLMVLLQICLSDHFKSNATFEAASKQSIVDISSSLKPDHRDKITISNAFSAVKEKRLHSLIVIAPIEAQDDLTTMKTEGLQLLEKTIFPTGDQFWRFDTTGIPKTVMLRMNQVPGLCDEEAVLEALQQQFMWREKLSSGELFQW